MGDHHNRGRRPVRGRLSHRSRRLPASLSAIRPRSRPLRPTPIQADRRRWILREDRRARRPGIPIAGNDASLPLPG